MAFEPVLTDEQRDEIRNAPREVSTRELVQRYGVSARTIQRLRGEARKERDEIRREVVSEHIAQHTRDHLSSALDDLAQFRKALRQACLAPDGSLTKKLDPRIGTLFLGTIKETLDRLGVDREEDPLSDVDEQAILDELEHRLGLRRE